MEDFMMIADLLTTLDRLGLCIFVIHDVNGHLSPSLKVTERKK